MKIRPIFIALIVAIFAVCFYKQQTKQVRVYVDVVGDLFHSGHIEFFKKARAQGNYLIVGVLSDEMVRAYKREPVIPHDERVKIIAACRYVDEVVPNCPLGVTDELIKERKIDLVVHGDDFDEEHARAQYWPAIEKNIFKFVAYTEGISSTDVLENILQRYKDNPDRFHKKDFFEGTEKALIVENEK